MHVVACCAGMPWFAISMYSFRKHVQRNRSRIRGERPSDDGPTAVEAYYFCPVVLAWAALLVLRTLNPKYDPCFKSWQYIGIAVHIKLLAVAANACQELLLCACMWPPPT